MECVSSGSLLKSNLIPDKEKMGKKDDGSLYKPDLLGKNIVTGYAVYTLYIYIFFYLFIFFKLLLLFTYLRFLLIFCVHLIF